MTAHFHHLWKKDWVEEARRRDGIFKMNSHNKSKMQFIIVSLRREMRDIFVIKFGISLFSSSRKVQYILSTKRPTELKWETRLIRGMRVKSRKDFKLRQEIHALEGLLPKRGLQSQDHLLIEKADTGCDHKKKGKPFLFAAVFLSGD